MRVIGIDPGNQSTGWCVLDYDHAQLPSFVDFGIIKTNVKFSYIKRLFFIHNAINNVVNIYKPLQMATEISFLNKNPRSSLSLERLRGAVLLTSAILNLEVFEYHACKIKEVIVGCGHASKDQVRYMVCKELDIENKPIKHDAYDACAIAMCHIYITRSIISSI
ncbi:Crossover junction endodeoxyribonuclease RuvC [Candidatus Xenohaliotis californiensis]|uniref:Crossover junction endodeoxyribonuclease RuvC n=1 Tax=Candidatus Xenohaliotis californiensis TaxID=84677 RepID=A0ABM9N865_9RICK|nr:Crossover junction endodeoxyribonuclease RuvC [Candidatus Xenohaliotis californiensis]